MTKQSAQTAMDGGPAGTSCSPQGWGSGWSRPAPTRFAVDRLDCYGLALTLAAEAAALVPRGHAALRNQIERATASVALNLAEGFGRWQPRDKSHFYTIARGSALEAAAAVDILRARRLASAEDCVRVAMLARRVALMLGGLIRSVERRAI